MTTASHWVIIYFANIHTKYTLHSPLSHYMYLSTSALINRFIDEDDRVDKVCYVQ